MEEGVRTQLETKHYVCSGQGRAPVQIIIEYMPRLARIILVIFRHQGLVEPANLHGRCPHVKFREGASR